MYSYPYLLTRYTETTLRHVFTCEFGEVRCLCVKTNRIHLDFDLFDIVILYLDGMLNWKCTQNMIYEAGVCLVA